MTDYLCKLGPEVLSSSMVESLRLVPSGPYFPSSAGPGSVLIGSQPEERKEPMYHPQGSTGTVRNLHWNAH